MRGFAFLTDYNGIDKCISTIFYINITPFTTGQSMIIVTIIFHYLANNMANNMTNMVSTIIIGVETFSKCFTLLEAGIKPTH